MNPVLKWDTLTVEREGEPVPDGQGGTKPGSTTTHEITGQLQPLSMHTEVVARTETAEVMWAFFCDYDADVVKGDTGTVRGFAVEVEGLRSSPKPGVFKRVTLKEPQQ